MTDPYMISVVDQAEAEAGGQLDALGKTFSALSARHGREQALCDVVALLIDGEPFRHFDRPGWASLVAVAVMRQAEQEPADYMEDTAREFLASLRMTRWQRVKAWFRSLFVEDETV